MRPTRTNSGPSQPHSHTCRLGDGRRLGSRFGLDDSPRQKAGSATPDRRSPRSLSWCGAIIQSRTSATPARKASPKTRLRRFGRSTRQDAYTRAERARTWGRSNDQLIALSRLARAGSQRPSLAKQCARPRKVPASSGSSRRASVHSAIASWHRSTPRERGPSRRGRFARAPGEGSIESGQPGEWLSVLDQQGRAQRLQPRSPGASARPDSTSAIAFSATPARRRTLARSNRTSAARGWSIAALSASTSASAISECTGSALASRSRKGRSCSPTDALASRPPLAVCRQQTASRP